MKKVLVSLTILLVALTGVSAVTWDTATLSLGTTIDEYARIGLSTSDTFTTTQKSLSVTALFDEQGNGVSNKSIGYVHFETNSPSIVTVTATASPLVRQNYENTIPYKLEIKVAQTTKKIQTAGFDTSGTGNTVAIYVSNQGVDSTSQELVLTILGTDEDYTAGDYEGSITFTVTTE
jgi:hypothetical protein